MSTLGPRLGFAGAGWIGLNRMQAVLAETGAHVAGILDPDPVALGRALDAAPGAQAVEHFETLLDLGLDGLVIATPNAFHAGQCRAALSRGIAVFCQKPLARSLEETRDLIAMARAANRHLAVDLSYRGTRVVEKIREEISSGRLGRVYAANLVFHNGYGPDKAWFYDIAQSGGGCFMDLGVHLVDMALWVLGFPRVERTHGKRFARGVALSPQSDTPEDFALARVELEKGALIDLACSWNLHVGCDAVISAAFYGSEGSVEFHNLNGSFYDFAATRSTGTKCAEFVHPPDAWGGKMIVRWVNELAVSPEYRSDGDQLLEVAAVMDSFYGREPEVRTVPVRQSHLDESQAVEVQ